MGRTARSRRPRGKPMRDRLPKPATESQRRRKPPPDILKAVPTKIGFGDLSAEIRNQIYELALRPSLSKSVRIIQPPGDHRTKNDLALGLLCACKAVREESWSFLYEKNDFRIDCVKLKQGTPEPRWPGYSVLEDGGSADDDAWHPSRLDDYQDGLKRFIDCTNHGKAFQSIRSITLAYYPDIQYYKYRNDPHGKRAQFCEGKPAPYARVVMTLKLLPKRPFYSLIINDRCTTERRDVLSGAIESMEASVRSILDPESGRKRFCKRDVEDIVSHFCNEIWLA